MARVGIPCLKTHGMLTYRTFRNTDPPVLANLWKSQGVWAGLHQPVTTDLLEQLVFSKLYFDYRGLVLAFDGDRPAGFAHAGFGPNSNQTAICTASGVICLLLVCPNCAEGDVAAGLVERCEDYLQRRGAKVFYGGGLQPINPFYLGLYGGSELPGILDADEVAKQAFIARGYQQVEQTVLLRRDLGTFEPPVDRQQMQVRRQMVVEVAVDVPARTWWDACTLGPFDLTRFELVPRGGGPCLASATFRSIEPSGAVAIGRSAGLVNLFVDEAYRRRGLAVFLLSEAFRQFLRQGIVRVEIQARRENAAALGAFEKVGFQPVGQGGLWKKDAPGY